MAETIETIAALMFLAIDIYFAKLVRGWKKRFDAILKELEDEMNG